MRGRNGQLHHQLFVWPAITPFMICGGSAVDLVFSLANSSDYLKCQLGILKKQYSQNVYVNGRYNFSLILY